MKIHEMITPEKWKKGLGMNDADATCAIGWTHRVYGSLGFLAAQNRLKDANGIDGIVAWNDAPERTFEEVKAAFQKADL